MSVLWAAGGQCVAKWAVKGRVLSSSPRCQVEASGRLQSTAEAPVTRPPSLQMTGRLSGSILTLSDLSINTFACVFNFMFKVSCVCNNILYFLKVGKT